MYPPRTSALRARHRQCPDLCRSWYGTRTSLGRHSASVSDGERADVYNSANHMPKVPALTHDPTTSSPIRASSTCAKFRDQQRFCREGTFWRAPFTDRLLPGTFPSACLCCISAGVAWDPLNPIAPGRPRAFALRLHRDEGGRRGPIPRAVSPSIAIYLTDACKLQSTS